MKKYNRYKQLNLLNIICNWHVSSLAAISGLIGYKTFKYSNLLYLWFQTFFYSKVFSLIFNKFNGDKKIKRSITFLTSLTAS